MRKVKRNIGQEILDGLRELKRGEVSRVIDVPDVATIREKTGLSQSRFAALLGVSVRTLPGLGARTSRAFGRGANVVARRRSQSSRTTRRRVSLI